MRTRIFILCFTILCILLAGRVPAEPTYAERLGWKPDDRVVIFHSDDAGMSHNTNTGTIEALEKGLVTSVSVMMPTPWVPEIVDYIKKHPDTHDFGLHLTMTSEWDLYRWGPVAGKPAVPGLVDEEGCLWDNVPLVVQNASADEVEREIRAQLDRALTMGFHPTHLDSHMGTLFSDPKFFERYVKVGIETGIPILISDGHMTHARVENREAIDMLPREIAKMVWDAGLPVIDDIHTASYGWKDPAKKTQQYIEMIRSLKPGITEVIMHCVHQSEEFPAITDSGPVRIGDFQAMMSPELRKVCEEEKIIFTTWRELKRRRDSIGKSGTPGN